MYYLTLLTLSHKSQGCPRCTKETHAVNKLSWETGKQGQQSLPLLSSKSLISSIFTHWICFFLLSEKGLLTTLGKVAFFLILEKIRKNLQMKTRSASWAIYPVSQPQDISTIKNLRVKSQLKGAIRDWQYQGRSDSSLGKWMLHTSMRTPMLDPQNLWDKGRMVVYTCCPGAGWGRDGRTPEDFWG